MRRRSLLAAGMLSVLLTTSACGAVTPPSSPARSSGPANAGFEASSGAGYDVSPDEIGATQRAAAAAAAQKADAATVQKTTAEAAAASRVPAAAPAPAAPAAAASAAALKQALKPSKTAPGLPASASELIVGTTGQKAHTWHANTPAGPAESGPVRHKDSGATANDEDPTPNGVERSVTPGEDARQAGTRISFPDARRSVTDKDTCDNCKDRNDSPCHQGDKADGASHSD